MKKILLIAGHGNGDPGAPGNSLWEADLTREVVKLLQPKLAEICSVDVADTSKNWYTYLQKHKYDFTKYDYVLEIHFNSGGGTGTEIFVRTDEKGTAVEAAIVKQICAATGYRNRGVKRRDNLYVMNTVKRQGVSHALLEVCFIDSAADVHTYTHEKNKIIDAIVNGIAEGFGLKSTAVKLTDISSHDAEKHIQKLVDYKIVSGYEDGTFRPGKHVTRAEYAVMVVKSLENACGYKLITGTNKFTDVQGHYAADAIGKITACGIVNGFSDGTFKPDEPITRAQAAMIMANFMRYCGIELKETDRPFPDTAANYADRHIQTLKAYGVVNGYADGTFRPDEPITRAEAAVMLANALTVIGK